MTGAHFPRYRVDDWADPWFYDTGSLTEEESSFLNELDPLEGMLLRVHPREEGKCGIERTSGDASIERGVSAVAITGSSAPARAYSAAAMQSLCQPVVNAQINANGTVTVQSTFEAGVCWGALTSYQAFLVMRVFNADLSKTTLDISNQLHLCVPKDVTLVQIARIFDRYATAHPQNLHDFYWLALHNSMSEAFRCAQQ